MEYFVIAPNGQRFGPATIQILNHWIQEGRIAPHTLLQDASSGAQIVARALPALSFTPVPSPADPSANPYDTPSPAQHLANYPQNSSWYRPPGVSTGNIAAAWICTVLAPLFIWFCYLGLAGALFGCLIGGQLFKQGNRVAGVALIGINVLWLVAYVVIRIWRVSSFF
jgi:hypothetical protein